MFGRQPVEWLVVGLGNPGREYDRTRHNMGFRVMDALTEKLGVRLTRLRFRALTATATVAGKKVLLMKPQTFMNASGLSVQPASAYYKIPPERILVIFDDISLPPGKIRIRAEGSAGGHNGLKSIISALGSQDFPRIKVGVGDKPHPDYELKDWVLSKPSAQEEKALSAARDHALEAVEVVLRDGCDKAAAQFNGL